MRYVLLTPYALSYFTNRWNYIPTIHACHFQLSDFSIKLLARFYAYSSEIATCKVTNPIAFHNSVSFTINFEYSYEQETHKFGSRMTKPSSNGTGYIREP